jgi:hypothetical protein
VPELRKYSLVGVLNYDNIPSSKSPNSVCQYKLLETHFAALKAVIPPPI